MSNVFLEVLFNRFHDLSYSKEWLQKGVCQSADTRPQIFIKIEAATLVYAQNIMLYEELEDEATEFVKEKGYGEQFAEYLYPGLRDQYLKINYLDSVFYAIEHLMFDLAKIHGIDTARNAKQDTFKEVLTHFGLNDAGVKKNELVKAYNKYLPDDVTKFSEANSKRLAYMQALEYLSLIRNALHANGRANKDMPNLSLGVIEFEGIVKESFLRCMSVAHISILVFCLLDLFEQLCLESFKSTPELVMDAWLEHLQTAKPENQKLDAWLFKNGLSL